MSRDDSADIFTALHGTTDEARDAALQRLCRGPDEPVSFDTPPLPSAGAGAWLLVGVLCGMALAAWVLA